MNHSDPVHEVPVRLGCSLGTVNFHLWRDNVLSCYINAPVSASHTTGLRDSTRELGYLPIDHHGLAHRVPSVLEEDCRGKGASNVNDLWVPELDFPKDFDRHSCPSLKEGKQVVE